MKTKKQLAAAAAAAAAAAEKKAASTSTTSTSTSTATAVAVSSVAPNPVKKPLKRLQTKAKEVSFVSSQPLKPLSQPSTSKTKVATSKPPVGPKSPVFAKLDTTGARTLSPAGKSSSSVGKVCKPTKNDATTNPVSHSETTSASKVAASVKKPDPIKSKKPSPNAEGVKKSTTGDKKKIQKELKNLGITDGTIHQIDAATVECNPSISEMVKTKSRATVSQQKYNETSSLGGSSASTAKATASGPKPETTSTNNEASNKPTEVSTIAATPIATSKKRAGTHPTSSTQKIKDAATQKTVPDSGKRGEIASEGGKTKIVPTTTLLATPQPPANTAIAAVKEVVKTPPTKLCDSKSKAKKPENNDDNNDATADQHKTTKRNTGATLVANTPKAKARTKKVILEERKAAEAARSKAVTEVPSAAAGSTTSLLAASAVVNAGTKHTDDKQKIEEEKTCSLGDLEPDDRHEADVQSRIEDIVKALEQEDDDEQHGAGGLAIHPKVGPFKTEPPIRLEEQSSATKEKTTKKATAKPKGSKSQRKAPTKKKPTGGEKLEAKDEIQKNSITTENNPSAAKTEVALSKHIPSDDVSAEKGPESISKGASTPAAKRKYVRKPKTAESTVKNVGAAASKKLDQKKSSVPELIPIRPGSQNTQEKDAQNSTENTTTEVPPLGGSAPSEKTNEREVVKQPGSPDPPKTLRSSTENDDDLPLNQLKDKTKSKSESPQVFTTPALAPTTVSAEPVGSSIINPEPTTPLLASLLTKPAKSRKKYVRKSPVKQSLKVPSSVTTKDTKNDKKSEKKDVYDFDDSESDIETPVKGGKPTFKRKPLESTSTIKDEEDDENSEEALGATKSITDEKESHVKPENKTENDESDGAKDTKKSPKKSSERLSTPSFNSDQSDDDVDQDPDERPRTPISRKVKQEVRDSSEDESDGYSSEESVRTRIVKKQLTAKTRHLKLYGFWSGPKRHRVASLNAIAKVHCLYENETRAALEASLMKQATSRAAASTTTTTVSATATTTSSTAKATTSKAVKKEKTDDDDERKHETGATTREDKDKSDKKEKTDEKSQKETKSTNVKEEKKKPTKSVTIKEDKKKETKKADPKEDRKDSRKKEKQKEETESESESEESEEEVVTRTLRCVPGLRGAGKHWDPNASSMESEDDLLPDSDETYAQGKDTDPVKKRKIKRKIIKKAKPKPKSEKSEKPEKSEKSDRPKQPAKKIKREVKALMSDSDKQAEESCSSSSGSEKPTASKSKSADAKKRKRKPKEKKEVVEVLAKKRMASLNATAMLAATYEVQRILYRNTDSDSDNPAHKPKSKKAKEQKDAKEKEASKTDDKKETKECKTDDKAADTEKTAKSSELDKVKETNKEQSKEEEKDKPTEIEPKITVKTELLRDRRDELEVKREIEEPRPMSSNVVIAQDTEVTITGVYVNSSLGANQEAYCKMQYRVQQSVTEERLVRPGEGPPRSYTPLSALSSMRPPNDQNLSTPPLFGQPSQCDSPLGLGPPRSFYPPPTSSSGSSSAFCAPIPHDSPGYYQPAGPLISPHLLPQPPPSSTSQHSSGSSTVTKQPPESDSPVQSLQQPPSSSTADSTDSDVLLTGGDLSSRSQPYRYGPTGPPNIYPRPVQMHCPPPPHLAPNYYAAPPYSQYPPEMYYTHAYPPAHFYPKFAQYYPSRRYYPGPPGPGDHMYEQAPPPTSAPVPPPAGAQLVPAGPQGPQHMEHYPGPPPYPYPGYGSPGPGPGGQCYSRNLQPPPYMDAHYTTNCPCPMQSCPKNVNAGSLIGIKASKGPVATVSTQNHHIASAAAYAAPAQTSAISSSNYKTSSEPIMISSGSSTSSSPAPLDIHAPIVCPAEVETSMCHTSPSQAPVTPVMPVNVACSSAAITSTTNTTTSSSNSITTTAEPNRTPKVKPESDLYLYNRNYHLHHHHYHQQHRPSAPPPTHPLQNFTSTTGPLLAEVKEEPSTPTPDPDLKSVKNIPKLIPITATMVKQEITEVKQELPPVVVTCKKEHFEENGPAMTPDLLLDEALIKKEELVTELLLPDRCFVQNQNIEDKCLLSDILTAEGNLVMSKTTGSDSCSNNNNNNNSSISNEKVQLVDSVLPEIPASTVKRRPLLVACKKATPKKSPPNSYKNLIKRTNLDEESTITVLSDDDEEDDEEEEVVQNKLRRKLLPVKSRKILKRTRRVFGAEQLRHLKKLSRSLLQPTRIRKIFKRPSCIPRNPKTIQQKTAKTVETKVDQEHTPKTMTTPNHAREESGVPTTNGDNSNKLSEATPETEPERPRPVSNVDLTIDLVAKGYFSEPEILSHEINAKSCLIKKLKLQKNRSQSEQNRGKHSSKKAKNDNTLDVDFDKRKSKCRSKKAEQIELAPLLTNSSPILTEKDTTKKAQKTKQPHQPKQSEPKEKKAKKEHKQCGKKKAKVQKQNGLERATSTPVPNAKEQESANLNVSDVQLIQPDASGDDREMEFDDAATVLVDDDMMSVDTSTMINRHNNNNSSGVENKNPIAEEGPLEAPGQASACEPSISGGDLATAEEDDDADEEMMLSRRFAKKSASGFKRNARSRSKSKSRKFSTKKRHRVYRMTAAEIEEVIVPRKCNSVPRWSNGWTWEGQPFQGKVFLNSDDPPVLRTCYPAMRHSEGDIIRPRDCVLLRAGSKRAELPYVAKVAYLWENPEDGEMMMSLLWYYRPEHTEQGRQPTDGPDEVFASRHKDHNSVACIEDKCYVLTFSEYCRFRRQLKGFEENIEEHPSIVPLLRRENPRLPPPVVSPELVMYCQRVYEFRLKRLLKTPS
ncbi:platelet binding protein GspB-like [Wyeomyia smithii]|uniref:platelet binding protein GspB-like n=1 Tax=Wyeomyia smithii TaxID=174621 RepID=UPI002467C92E|nr:platelet binding protein GspB-like [Wyeomyia smithii]